MTRRTVLILSPVLIALCLSFYLITRGGSPPPVTFPVSYSISSYERDPAGADLIIPKDEDKAFLEERLSIALDRATSASEEEKSIRILKYISSSIANKPNDGSATKVIRDGFALCGGKSNAFVMLCRKAKLPARYVGSMYMPSLRSHALGEVFYGGRWHLYDATYGIFFYSNPDFDGKGYVLSFHDLISDPKAGTVFKVVPEAGAGKFDDNVRTFPVTRIENDAERNKDARTVRFYREEMKNAFPVAYGSDDLVSYPVDANLVEATSHWFGEVNESDRELATYEVRFSGSHYVGSSVPRAFHTWLIKTLPHTTINIEYYSTYPNPPKLCLVPLRGARVIATRYEQKKVTFTAYVSDSEAIVSVYCPENMFSVDALHIYR
jgi:hypothetical protein